MAETSVTPPATVPEQPEASTPLNKKQPLLILLFIILLVFVVSSVVNAGKKAAPAKSQMTARPAAANPQQVNTFENQQEQVAKKDQEEQQQRLLDAPDAADADGKDTDEQARDWQIAVEQAETISKLAGKLPAGLERSLQGAEEARVDWRELLRRAWSETTPSDYSWMRPNRRHIWQGFYLPGVQREGVGEVVIFVDCSGSINARQLSLFEAEVRSILEGQRPERVYVVYFDAQVHKVDVYEAGQQIRLTPVGGGGTDFRPCFQWVEESHIQPQILVFLTDLYGTLPDHPPPHPVLWASTGSDRAPFGQVVPMQAA
ncbi:vWA domain-containing protein [Granulicella arctica]|uniref:Putative metal-dependent peptidase n=1 Tax=Granulicella arctica TaxID=940613 RepID=A0A7Y9PG31_9BACT|nr:VWA-like domain-containing protein [Granulicella arctica]NYF79064.1 putative metal-dependent peptidase [Granulicella arctica]